MKNQLVALTGFIAAIAASVPADTWLKDTVGKGDGVMTSVGIGPGRNDGVSRVYAGNDDHRVLEFSFNGSSWQMVVVGRSATAGINAVAVGAGRYDNVNRVYGVTSYGYTDYYYDFTYADTGWSTLTAGYPGNGGRGNAIALGNGRNTGVNYTYLGNGSLFGVNQFSGIIFEFNYGFGKLETAEVGVAGVPFRAVALGMGRNDGYNRIYGACEDGNLYECTMGGTGWQQEKIFVVQDQLMDVVVGQGRNDGVNRAYVASHDGHVYEISRNVTQWDRKDLGYGAASMNGIALGMAHNDGINRIYGVNTDKVVYEFTFGNGQWTKQTVGTVASPLRRVAVGDGESDLLQRVYVSDEGGYVTEFSFTGAPPTPPVIAVQPATQAVNPGARVDFTVKGFGAGRISYQWLKNGTPLIDTTRIYGATTTNLTLLDVSTNDIGVFSALVSNPFGTTKSSNATLIVRVPPTFTLQPVRQSVSVGESVTFVANAVGTPPLSYQWRLNGIAIPGATSQVYTVHKAGWEHAGYYTVAVSNLVTTVVSQPASLSFLSLQFYAGIEIAGPPGAMYRVDYKTNIESLNWIYLTNFVLPSSPYTFIDPDSPNQPRRFYRAETIP
jgi:hypothetical protein